MDEEKKEAEKIDIFSPAIVFALVAAFIGDFTFFLIITHYLCAAIAFGTFLPKVLPKMQGLLKIGAIISAILVFILPLPFIMLTILIDLLVANSKIIATVVEEVVEQVAIQAIAAATGGAGEALEGVAAGGTATQIGGEAIKEGVKEAAKETAKDVVKDTVKDKAKEAVLGRGENRNREQDGETAPQPKQEFDPATTGEERALLGEKGRLNEEFFGQPMRIPTGAGEGEEIPRPNNVVSGEAFQRARKIQDIKRQQEKPKPLREVTAADEDDENGDELKKAA